MFKTQSKDLMGAASKREKEVRSGLNGIANRYKLDTKNIFYVEPEEEVVKIKQVPTYEQVIENYPGMTKEKYDAWVQSKGK